jgi:hypothetical protein
VRMGAKREMNRWLVASLCVGILAVSGCLCALLLTVRATVAAIPAQIDATRASILAEVDSQASAVQKNALSAISGLTGIVDKRTAEVVEKLDSRAGDALARVAALTADADKQLTQANATLSEVGTHLSDTLAGEREDVKPLLAESQKSIAEIHALVDDNYDDLSATIANATVATAGVGRAMDEVAKAAPKMVDNSSAMVADFRRTVDDATKPKKAWQKAIGPIYTLAILLSHFL